MTAGLSLLVFHNAGIGRRRKYCLAFGFHSTLIVSDTLYVAFSCIRLRSADLFRFVTYLSSGDRGGLLFFQALCVLVMDSLAFWAFSRLRIDGFAAYLCYKDLVIHGERIGGASKRTDM